MRKKRVVIRLVGRCGNQLFQYAYAKAVALENNAELWVYGDANVETDWKNELKGFNVSCNFKPGDPLSRLDRYKLLFASKDPERKKDPERFLAKYRKRGFVLNYYFYPPKVEIKSRRILLMNVNEQERHEKADEIRDILLREITAKEPVPYSDLFTPEVRQHPTVCVSVRRGDFLSSKEKGLHFVCGETYFQRAILKAKERIKDPLFIVFSDDVEWCRQSGLFPQDSIYEKPGYSIPQKLMLMKECQNFIISNSTFSWWAQYLGTDPNKVVIAPSRWKNQGDYSYMYQPFWILVDP
jgi:Glycosyl transferase family 11.